MIRLVRQSMCAMILLGAGAHTARADEATAPAKCVVDVIHASKEGAAMDPKLERVRGYLEKEPFTAWTHFRLIESKTLTLVPKGSESFALPNGKNVTLTFVEHVITKKKGKHKLRTQLEITDGDKKLLQTVFALDEGGYVLQAGQRFQHGLLVLALSCETQE